MLDHVFLSVRDLARSVAFSAKRWRHSGSLINTITTVRMVRQGTPT